MKRVISLLLLIVAAALLSFKSITAQTIQNRSVQVRLQVHKVSKAIPKPGVGRRS
jgi:hypothetical protein